MDELGLVEAEELLRDWYSREGITPSHQHNLELLARLLAMHRILSGKTVGEVCKDVYLFIAAAFQMGRAAGGGEKEDE